MIGSEESFAVNLFAGSLAGFAAESILHPFDTISLRLKVQSNQTPKYKTTRMAALLMYKEEGIRGFFGGFGATAISAPITSAIYFGAYEVAKSVLLPHARKEDSKRLFTVSESLVYFLAGGFSELACSGVNVPFEVIKSRLQLGRNPKRASGGAFKTEVNYVNTWHACKSILQEEGVQGLYSGYKACLAVDMSVAAFSFLFYEQFKVGYKVYKNNDAHVFNWAELLSIGSVAGGIAAVLTNPLDVLTVRLMTQSASSTWTPQHSSLTKSLLELYHREGPSSLWKGTTARMFNIVPGIGISFAVYEVVKQCVFDHYGFHLDDFNF